MASFDFGIRIKATDGASSVLAGIQQKISGFGSSVGASVSTAADRMAKFGMATMGVQQITGALATVGDAFTNYESDLAAVSAVTGLAGKELDNIGNAARGLAKDFGGSASDQLKSFQGVLSKFGADQFKSAEGAKSLELISRNINTLSAASGDSAAQSMDVLANAMLQMGVNTDDAGIAAKTSTEYMNTLAASAQVGSAEIPQVGAAFLQVGVAAKGLNMDFNEVNTAIQVLGKGGKYGAEAGVALRNVMGLMMKASGPAEEAMKGLGTSSTEMGKILTDPSKGLNEGMKKLKAGLAKLPSDAARSAAMMNIFGGENAAAAGVLLNNTETYDNYRKAIRESAEAGAAQTQATIRMATSATYAARAQAYVNDMFLTAGQAIGKYGVAAISTVNSVAPQITALAGVKSLLPEGAFTSIKTGLTSAFSSVGGIATRAFSSVQGAFGTMAAGLKGFSFSGAFSSIATSASSAVSGMGSALSSGVLSLRIFAAQQLAAARGSALFSGGIGGFAKTIGGSLVGGVRSAISSVMAMNMAFLTSPVTWIVLGIAAAAFLIYKNWAPIKAFFGDLFDGIAGFFGGFMDGIGAAFSAPWSILQEVFAAFSPIIDAVKALFTPVEAVAGATGKTANQFAWLKDAGIVAGQYLGTAFRVIVTPILWVLKVIGQVIGIVTGLSTSGGNMAKVLIGAFTAITLPIQTVMGLLGGLWTFVTDLFSGKSFAEAGMNMIMSLWEGIQATWGKLVEGVKGLVGGITNLFSGKKDDAQAKATTAATGKTSDEAAKTASAAVQKAVPKEVKAPKVGKPKVPKADQPKLMPLRPPLAPDFKWIAKQNIESPKFKPMDPPKLTTDTGNAAKKMSEELKSISVEGTDLFSANSTAFKLPEVQLPQISDVKPLDAGAFGKALLPEIKLPSLQVPELSLPKLDIPNVSLPQLPDLSNPVPGVPPVGGILPQGAPPMPLQATAPAANGSVVVNFNVNINAGAASGGGASSAQDIANEVEQALRKMAPDIARQIEEATQQSKRLSFAGF